MRVLPLLLLATFLLLGNPSFSHEKDLFHERIDAVAAKFASLNIPHMEKIQLPQIQTDGSLIFIYIWIPRTHTPTMASFEANIGDYLDIVGAQNTAFAGWCYLKKPETHMLKGDAGEVAVMRIWVLGFRGRAPRAKCNGGLPSAAGQLGQTQVFKDPNSGLLSMVRSGHPTRFPLAADRVQ
jgi:hypothetical protein